MAACIDRARAQADLDDERSPPLILFAEATAELSIVLAPTSPSSSTSVDRPTCFAGLARSRLTRRCVPSSPLIVRSADRLVVYFGAIGTV